VVAVNGTNASTVAAAFRTNSTGVMRTTKYAVLTIENSRTPSVADAIPSAFWPGVPVSRMCAIWQPLLSKAGLPYRKYHATRHSYATWMLDAGADVRWVQQQMGHATIGQMAAPTLIAAISL
jgi:integrase